MDTRNDILNELKSESDILYSLKKSEHVDGLPMDYSITDTVMNRIDMGQLNDDTTEESVKKKVEIVSMQQYRRRESGNMKGYLLRVSVAASILLAIFFSVKKAYFSTIEKPCSDELACLEKKDVYQYLQDDAIKTVAEESIISTASLDSSIPSSTVTDNTNVSAKEAVEILTTMEEDLFVNEEIEIF